MADKIVVFGANGQLGQSLQKLAKTHGRFEWIFLDRSQCDFAIDGAISTQLTRIRPQYLINAAAYTAVDKAESDAQLCYQINAHALTGIGDTCTKLGIIPIHISSDYVYHSITDRPLQEDDPTLPQGVYAKSKLLGEDNLRSQCPASIIIRTSWVYSEFGNNFVKTMLRLGATKDELSIVSDQVGCPTYATDIATTLISIIDKISSAEDSSDIFGIYNFCNAGQTNWADFATRIFELENLQCAVTNITTDAYNAPAPRPLWSVMDTHKITNAFGIKMLDWGERLSECIDGLKTRVDLQ